MVKKGMDKQRFIAIGVLVALIVTLIQFTFKNPVVSVFALLGGALVLLFIVKKWVWPTMWGFAVMTETIALFMVIYFIMTMIYLIYVALALKFGWAQLPTVGDSLLFLGQGNLN